MKLDIKIGDVVTTGNDGEWIIIRKRGTDEHYAGEFDACLPGSPEKEGIVDPAEITHINGKPINEGSTDWEGGLPPVGAAVDAKCTAKTKARDWFPAEVMYISPYTVVLRDYSTEELDGEFIAHPCTMLFSPRKTQAQIEAQERERVIQAAKEEVESHFDMFGLLPILEVLFDAGMLQEPKQCPYTTQPYAPSASSQASQPLSVGLLPWRWFLLGLGWGGWYERSDAGRV